MYPNERVWKRDHHRDWTGRPGGGVAGRSARGDPALADQAGGSPTSKAERFTGDSACTARRCDSPRSPRSPHASSSTRDVCDPTSEVT